MKDMERREEGGSGHLPHVERRGGREEGRDMLVESAAVLNYWYNVPAVQSQMNNKL